MMVMMMMIVIIIRYCSWVHVVNHHVSSIFLHHYFNRFYIHYVYVCTYCKKGNGKSQESSSEVNHNHIYIDTS